MRRYPLVDSSPVTPEQEHLIAGLSPEEVVWSFRALDLAWTPDGRLLWLEQRGRDTALVLWNPRSGCRRDLTRETPPRAQAGYGGGDFGVSPDSVWYVAGGALYRRRLDSGSSVPVVETGEALSSPVPSPDGKWVALVAAGDDRDRLCLIDTAGGNVHILYEAASFCAQPVWHPAGDRLAWIAWDEPFMPWQRSQVCLARLGEPFPNVADLVTLPSQDDCACFQPAFSPDGCFLSFVSDRGGWFNVEVFQSWDLAHVHTFAEAAEYAPPMWQYGLRSYGWHAGSDTLTALAVSNARAGLRRLSIGKRAEELPAPSRYTWFAQPAVSGDGSVALLASASDAPPAVLVRGPDGAWRTVRSHDPACLQGRTWSRGEHVRWKSEGRTCYGVWYSPVGETMRGAALKVHGGPTSQQVLDWDPDVQFFTTRGWGVLAVNYLGSSGYGRDYREGLNSRWGEADVADVGSAADYLVEKRGVAPERMVLFGGSAGGYTVLLALARYPGRFRGAVCRFPVTRPAELRRTTHRFERGYLDTLLGPWPAAEQRYLERCPFYQADQIGDPLVLFHGDRDVVVPVNQTLELADRLRVRGVPVRVYVFPGEGHGWRRPENLRRYYALLERVLESGP